MPLQDTPKRINAVYLYLIALVAAVGGFLFGYDLQLISGAILFLEKQFELSPSWKGLVAGSAIIGCPVGPLFGLWIADAWGRKRTLILAGILFMVSALGSAVAPDMIQLIIWRFVGGLGVGLAATVSPMYIAEIAPPRLRGRLVVVNQLAIVAGLTLAVVVCWWLSKGAHWQWLFPPAEYPAAFQDHWRWMFASEAIPIFALLIGLLFVPNSPRWLAARGNTDGAFDVLARINGPEQARAELADIAEELGEEQGGFRELLRPGIFTALVIGLAIMVFSQINGVNMVLLYTPSIFAEAGFSDPSDAIFNTIFVDLWITLCTIVALRPDRLVRPSPHPHCRDDLHGDRPSPDLPAFHLRLAALGDFRRHLRHQAGPSR